MQPERRSIFVVNSDQAANQAIRELLASHGQACESFLEADKFLSMADLRRPGCLIADIRSEKFSGTELQQALRSTNSPLKVVFVGQGVDVTQAVRVMREGALTVLAKPYDPMELIEAVEEAVASSLRDWEATEQNAAFDAQLASLSQEEMEVLEGMLAGLANKSIAHQLSISPRTVDRRRRAVHEKLRVDSVAEISRKLGAMGVESVRKAWRRLQQGGDSV